MSPCRMSSLSSLACQLYDCFASEHFSEWRKHTSGRALFRVQMVISALGLKCHFNHKLPFPCPVVNTSIFPGRGFSINQRSLLYLNKSSTASANTSIIRWLRLVGVCHQLAVVASCALTEKFFCHAMLLSQLCLCISIDCEL